MSHCKQTCYIGAIITVSLSYLNGFVFNFLLETTDWLSNC